MKLELCTCCGAIWPRSPERDCDCPCDDTREEEVDDSLLDTDRGPAVAFVETGGIDLSNRSIPRPYRRIHAPVGATISSIPTIAIELIKSRGEYIALVWLT